jgi:hypothetical protein
MISTAVPAGAPTPNKELASKPGTVSAIVGTPDSISNRSALATASTRNPPVLMCSRELTQLAHGVESGPSKSMG